MHSRPAYDETERARIRGALQRYKDEHDVGVPTLQLRIAEAIGDADPSRVPLKSLQRFLADTHRTDDALVDHCARFLSMVAPPPAADILGEALAGFFGERTEALAGLAGRYLVGMRPVRAGQDGAAQMPPGILATGQIGIRDLKREESFAPFSVLTLEAANQGGFLRASESMLGPDQKPLSWSGHSGLLVPYGEGGFLIVLRSYVDSRLCLVRPNSAAEGFEGGLIWSAGTQIMPSQDSQNFGQPQFEIQIIPMPIKEETP